MAAIKTYTRVDYDRIKREGFNFVLPQETINAIYSLVCEKIGLIVSTNFKI